MFPHAYDAFNKEDDDSQSHNTALMPPMSGSCYSVSDKLKSVNEVSLQPEIEATHEITLDVVASMNIHNTVNLKKLWVVSRQLLQ